MTDAYLATMGMLVHALPFALGIDLILLGIAALAAWVRRNG